MSRQTLAAVVTGILALVPASGVSADDVIPHAQSRAPGPALTAAEAVKRMTVPKGFTVEVVASEPDLVNPVAMAFDERGRVWVTESLEYPRKSAGPGRDRVKILEDTDGDGKADKFTIFAEGLKIPSGIAVGHGGVWVANSPDILFLKDTDGDGKADTREVIVTGFGRDDTHELPNTLTWGPDGALYGWNGVFNRSVVRQGGKTFDFTCAIFRIDPKTREFGLFCEGTSNPWGLAFDPEGSAFASACVIDHFWHLTETGYYHRQGGPYPAHTWKIESIVDHAHQQAAYCGLTYYDSDVYPKEYRDTFYMGNIHAGGLNVDTVKRKGSTYTSSTKPDFLQANDAWFMPVSQKTGPDGCLYVLDWYDRYHCYQDANRDPAGIDRLKGRLYRVRYGDAPRRSGFDLGKESVDGLIARLGSGNGYDRETARRLLAERADNATLDKLEDVVRDAKTPRRTRLNALWAMVAGGPLDHGTHFALLADADPTFRAWGVRAAGNARKTYPKVVARVEALAHDPSPDVQLQVAIAARKVEGIDPLPLLVEVASACGDDALIPHIVWRNAQPLLGDRDNAAKFVGLVTPEKLRKGPGLAALVPHAVGRLLDRPKPGEVAIATLVGSLRDARTEQATEAAGDSLALVGQKVMGRGLAAGDLDALRAQFAPVVKAALADHDDPTRLAAALLAATWSDPDGLAIARSAFHSQEVDEADRLGVLDVLIDARDPSVLDTVAPTLGNTKAGSPEFRGKTLASLGKLDDPRVARVVLDAYPSLEAPLQPRAIELLTQRAAWREALVEAVRAKTLPRSAFNLNQVSKLSLATTDPAKAAELNTLFGSVRETRNPRRERVIADTKKRLQSTPGDPLLGVKVFERVCAQCHKIYGQGQEVGPEITRNGRASYEQLLSNVLDPSLVIGAAYQATTVATDDGRVLSGLIVEDTPERVVLKLQGGKLESVGRDDIDAIKVGPLSLMPEGLEEQLSPQELADLFAYITLDRPPTDPDARRVPGAEDLPAKSRGVSK